MSKKKLIQGKIYRFEWADTYGFSGWYDDEDIEQRIVEGVHQVSTGFLVKITKDWYIIAMHYNPNRILNFPKWGAVSWIPKGSVKRVVKL